MVSRTRVVNKKEVLRVQRWGIRKHWWQRERFKNDETFKKLPKSMRSNGIIKRRIY